MEVKIQNKGKDEIVILDDNYGGRQGLQDYHLVWLSTHPERTSNWLRLKLHEGFEVHHLDGFHENNDSNNLVLIEARDHGLLHDGKLWKITRVTSSHNKEKQILTSREKWLREQENKRKQGWLPPARPARLGRN